MQIMRELSEAMEAHRHKESICTFVSLPSDFILPKMDEIKDTFELK